jgi:hypothetical protein
MIMSAPIPVSRQIKDFWVTEQSGTAACDTKKADIFGAQSPLQDQINKTIRTFTRIKRGQQQPPSAAEKQKHGLSYRPSECHHRHNPDCCFLTINPIARIQMLRSAYTMNRKPSALCFSRVARTPIPKSEMSLLLTLRHQARLRARAASRMDNCINFQAHLILACSAISTPRLTCQARRVRTPPGDHI